MCAWIVPKLDKRVQILRPIQRPQSDGSFEFGFGEPTTSTFDETDHFEIGDEVTGDLIGESGYQPITTVWMGMVPVDFRVHGLAYTRGEQTYPDVTHEFIVRKLAIQNISMGFGKGFSNGFDSIEDLNPIKSELYFFVENGTSTVKGRLFRVDSFTDRMEMKEFYTISAKEVEERGTGWPR